MLFETIYQSMPTGMTGIFKTNIATHEDKQNMINAIRHHFEVGHCHIDLEDCDKVLRITNLKVEEKVMIEFVQRQGFYCDILE